jgi:organic hydroperoxide reductase OsmC/OhrA
MESSETQKARHKSFTYKTSLKWTDGKSGMLSSEGKPSFRVASPPEFKGESGAWTPEDLFVASVEICQMTTFLSFAARKQLPVISYQSHANGVLEFIDGDYRFTRIVLFPTVVVAKSASEEDVYSMLREAHDHCLVANSIASIVEVNPTIMLQ